MSCGAASDQDCWYPDNTSKPGKLETDYGFTYTWYARWKISGDPAGEFKNDDNTGMDVIWIAPAGSGDVIVTVTADSGEDKYPDSGSDSKIIRIATITLEEVTFGGSKKHLLNKKDSNQWNPSNEDYGTDYGTAVPDKAWTRDPAFSDPICYTKGVFGDECTATLKFSMEPSLDRSVTIYVKGGKGGDDEFYLDIGPHTVSGSSATVGPLKVEGASPSYVGKYSWNVSWKFTTSDIINEPFSSIGTSSNTVFFTYGTPNGDGDNVTAKRMNWAALTCQGESGSTQLGEEIALKVNIDTDFGSDNPSNRWEPLDGVKAHDCLKASELAKKALLLLGVSTGDCGTQKSYASSDDTGDPDYPSDVTNIEYRVSDDLDYTDNDGGFWNNYEGSFRVKDDIDDSWGYWTVFPRNGRFEGTGDSSTEKDKSAKLPVKSF